MINRKHNILILGSGGREHALVKKISSSKNVYKTFVCPGNGGTSNPKLNIFNININLSNLDELINFVSTESIDLTIVGPEQPLVGGIVDVFKKNGLNIFGPSKKASRIEGSKIWAYKLMEKYNIPCPKSEVFDQSELAKKYVRNFNPNDLVLKVDGLAGGKGVFLPKTEDEINKTIEDILDKKIFGSLNSKILISERIYGPEVSVFAFVDGGKTSELAAVCDYKRIFENDEGPNTGGVGAYSPPEFWKRKLEDKIKSEILYPTINALSLENSSYSGVLYIGVMVTKTGPMVIEYNCRFGDPETQILMSKLDSDLFEICMDISKKIFDPNKVVWNNKNFCFVMMTSEGYPGDYEVGKLISGLENVKEYNIIHSGTKKLNKNIFTNGGRVIGVVGEGASMIDAINESYKGVSKIYFRNSFYRKDIGKRAINES